jgi:hypothetical protein
VTGWCDDLARFIDKAKEFGALVGNVWTVGHNLTKALETSLGETGPGTACRCRWQGAGQGDEKVHYLADRRHCQPVAADLQYTAAPG